MYELWQEVKLKEQEYNQMWILDEERHNWTVETLEKKLETTTEEKVLLRGELNEKEKILTCALEKEWIERKHECDLF